MPPALTIESLEQNGYGVTRHHGKVCFVEGALPGEIVDIEVVKNRRSHCFAVVRRWHRRSPQRITPFCKHFSLCGGCRWQYLSYPDQLRYKQQFVSNHLLPVLRQHGLTEEAVPAPLPSPLQRYHRNKLEFAFTATRWLTPQEIASHKTYERRALGFHIRGRFNRIVDIEHCWLQASPSNQIRNFCAQWARLHGYQFYNQEQGSGTLRTLIVRTSTSGEVMVIVVFATHTVAQRVTLLRALERHFPTIRSLYWVHNQTPNDSIERHPAVHFAGQPTIPMRCRSLSFHIHPKSFFQTNSHQLETLCSVVLEFLAPQKNQTLYDLYCGIGTLTLVLAPHCKVVWGIEVVPEAVENARYNAQVNNIQNAHFIRADVAALLASSTLPPPHTIVVDPPRAGLTPKVCQQLCHLSAPRLLYISCNPATQARDLLALHTAYRIVRIQPIDMFPHSSHIENIALLEHTPSTRVASLAHK